jgi:hypothetical protein
MRLMVKRSRRKSPVLNWCRHALAQTHQMCPIGADFKHFRAAENRRISDREQYLVNHANQGLVNHARKSGAGDTGLTRLFKPKRTGAG